MTTPPWCRRKPACVGLGLVLAATIASPPAYAQEPAVEGAAVAPTFLIGEWTGNGELFGQPATFRMTWDTTLEGRFYRLRFANALGGAQGSTPILQAEALYGPVGGDEWRGSWFDTRGKRLDLRAEVRDGGMVLRVEWTDPGVESGVTVYRRAAAGTVEVIDSVRAGDGMRLFGRASYTRR